MDNLDELVVDVAKGGGRVVRPVAVFENGLRFAFVADPEDNQLELVDPSARAAT
ncbi:hypothetical protein MKW14_33345 [Streptomyces sp. CME 23]|nr:hypothetical protein [Streptomyces sp. CME 23]MCH5676623.1 hypothetical protein [Streptomyces sp. CME 23]